MSNYDLVPFPTQREIVVDAGYLAARRHIIFGFLEVDVTNARQMIRSLSSQLGSKVSFTAFLVACLGRAIASAPEVQAYRNWRRQLVVFHDVDVVTMIEPEAGAVAIPHIIRAAQHKTVLEISDEIRSVQANPGSSEQNGGLVDIAPRIPRFLRLLYFWVLKKNPPWFQQMAGTTVITSVGMFGKGGGWGLGFLPTHTLGITVGGIAEKPGVVDGQIAIREYLNLTVAFDHDIVDGAPAARFAKKLTGLIEQARLLDSAAL
jgi:pyruvate/2-oxoglutarate dehydrogenase complex dihydrolipoamide acyltransferase (E2) component